jgi:hypothetical protein
MAALAVDSKVLPCCVIAIVLRVKILLFLAYVARVASFIPDLDLNTRIFLWIPDIQIMDPLFADIVPAGRKKDDAAVRQCREVLLNSPPAKRVLHPMFPGLAR